MTAGNNDLTKGDPTLMRALVSLLTLMAVSVTLLAGDDAENERERLESSAVVLEEILNIPDALPKDLLNKAECVAVMPSVKKFALGIGGSYGKALSSAGPERHTPEHGERPRCIGWKARASVSN
jgi:lipid-binding SYLF domain-containing protein